MKQPRRLAAAASGVITALLVAGFTAIGLTPAFAADAILNPNPPVSGSPAAVISGGTATAWALSDCHGNVIPGAEEIGTGASYTPNDAQIGYCLIVVTENPFGRWESDPIVARYTGTPTPAPGGTVQLPGVGTPSPAPGGVVELPGVGTPGPLTPLLPVVTPPVATPDSPQCGTHEAAGGGVALPGGGGSVAPGGTVRVRLASGANEHVALAVTYPGAASAVVIGGTTNDEGNAFFNIRVPARTAAGEATLQGANAEGGVIFDACFTVAGRAVHPAAG